MLPFIINPVSLHSNIMTSLYGIAELKDLLYTYITVYI